MPQLRHLARRIMKLMIGILSYQWIGSLHPGQCEVGKTTEAPGWGNLMMTTLRKLPTMAPIRVQKMATNVSNMTLNP
jgi:hypothetical protein